MVAALLFGACHADSVAIADGGSRLPDDGIEDTRDLSGADQAPSSDLQSAPDMSGRCEMMSSGFNDPEMTCVQAGICDGHVYRMRCDGKQCTCSIDDMPTASFPQTFVCRNIGATNVWSTRCMLRAVRSSGALSCSTAK